MIPVCRLLHGQMAYWLRELASCSYLLSCGQTPSSSLVVLAVNDSKASVSKHKASDNNIEPSSVLVRFLFERRPPELLYMPLRGLDLDQGNGAQTDKQSMRSTFPWSLSTTVEEMHVQVIPCNTSFDIDAWRGGKV